MGKLRSSTLTLLGGTALLCVASVAVILFGVMRPPARAKVPGTAIALATATSTRTPTPTQPALPPIIPRPAGTVGTVAATPATPTTGGPNAIAPGRLNLTATYASIGLELFFTGDDNGNASANLEFKAAGEATWRAGLPLWEVGGEVATPGRAFYGSALLLTAGTKYEVRVALADPDGITGQRVVTGTVSTRTDDVPAAATLKPTHFVSPTGDDEADGTAGKPWRTLGRAFTAAPAGAVVQVAPGYYAPPEVERELPITLVAQKPAATDALEPINLGARSVIEPPTFSSPAGTAGAAFAGTWTRVLLTGPATKQQHAVWKWAGSPVDGATRLTVAPGRADIPQRVAYWDRKPGAAGAYTMETPAGWAEVLYRNETYNFGFTSFGNDLYLRLPGDQDPNTLYVTATAAPVGTTKGRVVIDAPDVRLTGFEFRSVDLIYGPGAAQGTIDHNLFRLGGLLFAGAQAGQGAPSGYGADHLVQFNAFLDNGTWSVDPARPAIPWLFIKSALRLNGQATIWSRVGAEAETAAIGARGGARRVTIRRNQVDGFFNGIGVYNEGFDRYSQQDCDVYDNLIRHIADDGLEPEQQAINWRIWNNRLEETSTALSTGPVAYGPIYFFRNEVWRLGSAGVGADSRGEKGIGVVAFKFSGSSKPGARIVVVHNTVWTDQPGADGGNQYAGGGANSESFYLRNNVFRMTRYAFAPPQNAPNGPIRWDEDYDFFFTTDQARGVNYGSNRLSLPLYRAASGQGANSNRGDAAGAFHTEPGLTDAAKGQLVPAADSPLIDAGIPVPNVSDRPNIDFRGGAPDLGARERP